MKNIIQWNMFIFYLFIDTRKKGKKVRGNLFLNFDLIVLIFFKFRKNSSTTYYAYISFIAYST